MRTKTKTLARAFFRVLTSPAMKTSAPLPLFSKEELLNATARILADRAMQAGSNGAATYVDEEPTIGKRRRRKKNNKDLTPSRSVSAQQILELIRAKGPLRSVEIGEITGLAPGAVRLKMLELKKEKAVNEVREGTIVRYDAARGGAGRKTSVKAGKKTRRSSGKKKRASKKTAVNAVASA